MITVKQLHQSYGFTTKFVFCFLCIFIFVLTFIVSGRTALAAAAPDSDKDGLNDAQELIFKTDPTNPDSDGDGHKDGLEVDWAYDPLSSSTKKMPQRLEIDLKKQKLTYFVNNQAWKDFVISSGKPGMATPKGDFKILNKSPKAWSKTYGLWMPYWLGLNRGEFGIHELPIWPGGYREGADHLGKPVSHGCVRLGIGSASYIYDRVAVHTPVIIK